MNLAKKPFINRRPVVRLAAVLWALGGLLLAVNFFLYSSHWQGTADNRKLLAESERSLREQEQRLEEQDRQLTSLNLRSKNREAAFLNGLISQRTFPWSALFDHLERVTPIDIRLVTVQPAVHLAGSENNTRGGRRSGRNRSATSVWDANTTENGQGADEVELRLSGWSKTEEALTEFIDTLYQDPSFRRILLRNEALENEAGRQSIRFNLEVLFLTGLSKGSSETLVADTEDPEDDALESTEPKADELEAPVVQAAVPPPPVPTDGDDEDGEAPPVIAPAPPEPEQSVVAEEVAAARRESSPRPRRVEADDEEADDEDEEEVEEDRASLSRRQRLEALRARSRERAAARDRRQNQAEETGRRSAVAAGIQVGPGAVVGGRVDTEDGGQGQRGNRGVDPGNPRNGGDDEFPDQPASSTPGVSWLLPDWMPRLDDFGLELGLVIEEEAEG